MLPLSQNSIYAQFTHFRIIILLVSLRLAGDHLSVKDFFCHFAICAVKDLTMGWGHFNVIRILFGAVGGKWNLIASVLDHCPFMLLHIFQKFEMKKIRH